MTGIYEHSGEIARVEREIWPRYLNGEWPATRRLQTIVEELDPRPGGE